MSTGVTVQKHKDIAAHILSMHALIGCDTVSATFGIGRVKAINIFNKPPVMGNVQEDKQFVQWIYTSSVTMAAKHMDVKNSIPNMENENWS